tara:strand:- start:377 stop:1141 length:765 start_codon:yes stop_codon:yes gene_type:complete
MENRFKTDSKEYKLLHLAEKSWLRALIQGLILKILSKLSPEKSLSYKNKIIAIKLKITQFLSLLKGIFLKFKYPMYFRLPFKHICALNALIKFLKILKMQKIDFFLLDGSLLGAVRQESFAGRPKDVDLGIKEDQFSKLLDAIPLLINHGSPYIKTKPHHKIQKLQIILEGVLIDVEFFKKEEREGTEMWIGQTYDKSVVINSFPIEDLENLVPVKIYGKTFMSPSNPEMYLEKKFGKNWRVPDKKQFFWKKQI